MIIINKLDNHGNQLEAVMENIIEHFGDNCLPINLPSADAQSVVDCYFEPEIERDTLLAKVEEAHETLIDQVIEVDEELMELYLEQGSELTAEQLHDPFEEALRTGHVIPICFVSSETGAGVELLLRTLAEIMPMPNEGNPPLLEKNGKKVKVNCEALEHSVAHVYKISVDPYMGKLATCVFTKVKSTQAANSTLAKATKRSKSVISTNCKAKTERRSQGRLPAISVCSPKWMS